MAMKNRTGLCAIGFTALGFIFIVIAFCTPCWLETDGKLSDPQFVRIVFFEPTDYHCSKKPFQTSNYQVVKLISPNFNELQVIAQSLGATIDDYSIANGDRLPSAAKLANYVAKYIDNVLVTLGEEGLLIARRNNAGEPLLTKAAKGNVQIRHYPALKCNNLVNVSGAGDCLAAGIITAMLDGRSEENCVNIGMHSSLCSLSSSSAIPKVFFDKNHQCWNNNAKYFTMNDN